MTEFEKAYQSYALRVYRFLLALTGNEQQADELTQEVFYRALVHIGRYQEQGSMLTWLCTIGKNAWLSEYRKGRKTVPLETAPTLSVPGPEAAIMKRERHQALRRAIVKLPEDQRDVVILHIYGGIPLKEIAAQRGKSESWGKVTYFRAKQKLAQELEEFK
ncbi:MAG: RNA polymerase sigma factor [Oscillospiraceae bacterium]|nr:RNA polymerase sigma factor [Oscillospiraceae bacterium]